MTTPNERLKIARAKKFATAVEAADALGIKRSTYLGHENGRRNFPAKRAPIYARRFGVTEEWLLYAKGAGPKDEVAATRTVLMAVQFPNEFALTEMFAGMLNTAGRPEIADELAPRLARLLPDVLGLALGIGAPLPTPLDATSPSEASLRPATAPRDQLLPPST